VGSIEVGKWADLVIWKPAFFGVKPALILKGGFIAVAAMGDPNASHPDAAAGALPAACSAPSAARSRRRSLTFVSQAGLDAGIERTLRPGQAAGRGQEHPRRAQAAHGPQRLPARPWRSTPQTYQVRADGQLLTCEPAVSLPMAQRYFLF